jgi:hypothetical protein
MVTQLEVVTVTVSNNEAGPSEIIIPSVNPPPGMPAGSRSAPGTSINSATLTTASITSQGPPGAQGTGVEGSEGDGAAGWGSTQSAVPSVYSSAGAAEDSGSASTAPVNSASPTTAAIIIQSPEAATGVATSVGKSTFHFTKYSSIANLQNSWTSTNVY